MLYYILTFSLGFGLGALFMGTVKFFLSDKHMADLRAEQGDIDISELGQRDSYGNPITHISFTNNPAGENASARYRNENIKGKDA